MSTYDDWRTRSGDDEQDALNFAHVPRPNCHCSECGRGFHKGPQDVGNLCDACVRLADAIREWQRTRPKAQP